MNNIELKTFVESLLTIEVSEGLFYHHGHLCSYTMSPKYNEGNVPWLNFLDSLRANNVTVEGVESYGGEDMGSDYWSVYKFSHDDTNIYVKFYGWYASHVGSEYLGWKFVEPVTVTRVEYE